MEKEPQHCRQAAYDAFAAQLASLEETDSLVRAAVAVSMHQLDDLDPGAVVAQLDRLAADVKSRVRSSSESALAARLHELLFDELGFSGNADDYYDPANSYLSKVLATRRGIPVTLSLIYKSVAQKVGLVARGINAPAHFLAAAEVDGAWMIVDPFDGGRALARDEVFDRLEQIAGAPIQRCDELLATATHPQWLARIISNLVRIFQEQNRETDMLAMQELLALLPHGK